MYKPQQQVREFHEKYGSLTNNRPSYLKKDDYTLRANLIGEEAEEYYNAALAGDLVGVADALGDLLYVVFGTAVAHGIDLEPVFEEIHRSNMTKDGGGKRSDGKILKGPDYSAPNLAPILYDQGWGDASDGYGTRSGQ